MIIEVIKDKEQSDGDVKMYHIYWRKNNRFNNRKTVVYFQWEDPIKEYIFSTKAFSFPIPREVLLKIESILRGLNSNRQ